jgi:hypothetical protein
MKKPTLLVLFLLLASVLMFDCGPKRAQGTGPGGGTATSSSAAAAADAPPPASSGGW